MFNLHKTSHHPQALKWATDFAMLSGMVSKSPQAHNERTHLMIAVIGVALCDEFYFDVDMELARFKLYQRCIWATSLCQAFEILLCGIE